MSWLLPSFAVVAIAVVFEMMFGYPAAIHSAVGHPVEWMGRLIGWLDRTFNDPGLPAQQSRLRGIAAELVLLAVTGGAAVFTTYVLSFVPLGWVVEGLLASGFIAQRSLRDHVKDVIAGLDLSLDDGRAAVSKIVGRDPTVLDESGIARGALESLAENTSDGVIAPLFWLVLFGLPGIVLYKAINTADSMIGHKSERYLHFGWAAARLDDLVNLPCSRLSGLLFVLVGGRREAFNIMMRDAPRHQSPNAGWPEAALAGALGIRLGGPRSYDGETVDLPTMGSGRSLLDRNDIRRGLTLYGWAMSLLAMAVVIIALAA